MCLLNLIFWESWVLFVFFYFFFQYFVLRLSIIKKIAFGGNQKSKTHRHMHRYKYPQLFNNKSTKQNNKKNIYLENQSNEFNSCACGKKKHQKLTNYHHDTHLIYVWCTSYINHSILDTKTNKNATAHWHLAHSFAITLRIRMKTYNRTIVVNYNHVCRDRIASQTPANGQTSKAIHNFTYYRLNIIYYWPSP